jgi:hypothetical protein
MEKNRPEPLYKLKGEPEHFVTGRLPSGAQWLMSVVHPHLVAVEFDAQGNYVRAHARAMPCDAGRSPGEQVPDDWMRGWAALNAWASETGLARTTIAVKQFSLPEYDLRIQELPPVWQELLESSGGPDEEAREEIENWKKADLFVLVWGNDYEIDQAGNVVST